MKGGILLGVGVVLVFLSQAGIGYLAFHLESKEKALAVMQNHEQERIETLRVVAAQTEGELQHLQSKRASLEGSLASLRKQVAQVEVELEERSGRLGQLQMEEKRLEGIADESKKAAIELASLEAGAAAAQDGLEAKQKQAASLDARIQGLLDEFERMTKDSAFVSTAESVGKSMSERLLTLQATLSEQEEEARASAAKAARARVILERASEDLRILREQKSALEEDIFARRRELATLDGEISSKKRETVDATGTSKNVPEVPE